MKKSIRKIDPLNERTDFGPGGWNLYHNNKGLFSDPYLDERLKNIENYPHTPGYDFLVDYWNCDDHDAVNFYKDFQKLRELYKNNVKNFNKYNEAQLEEEWVKKIFDVLGWSWIVQDSYTVRGKNRKPDYSLFSSAENKQKSFKADGNSKFKYITAVADAKAWDVDLSGRGNSNDNPSYQITRYMEDTGCTWGILTNGQFWRIYSLKSETKHNTFYEIDLDSILCQEDPLRFKYFYNFFKKDAFVPYSSVSEKCFLDLVFEDGQHYALNVEEDLKQRAYEVVEKICNSFLDPNKKFSQDELQNVYTHSLYYLFKLMFILNSESKALLNVSNTSDYYPYSLRKICMELLDEFKNKTNWGNGSKTYLLLNNLFQQLAKGDEDIGIHAFGYDIFASGSKGFFDKSKAKDIFLNDAIVHLATNLDSGKQRLFIDYKRLSPDHLGSIFEGLLEFELVQEKSSFVLLNQNGERKASGSYYTPSHISDYIIEKTLTPVIDNMSVNEILDIKLCDPSMGSGHFLLGAVKFLEKKILDIQDKNPEAKDNLKFNEIKWHILHNCIHGVDINPIATELAKLSLWIYTAEKGEKLESLKDRLHTGNSLDSSEFDWKVAFRDIMKDKRFDAIVGNPPYDVMEKDRLGEVHPHKLIVEKLRVNDEFKFALGGKLNLYRFFLVKALDLMKNDGQFGMIIPMSLIGDISCKTTRNYIISSSADLTFDCFPQKDDKKNRVFKEAKVSTCVMTLRKSEKNNGLIKIRSMPGRDVLSTIDYVSLKLQEIKLVDPDNFAIPMVNKSKWKALLSVYGRKGVTFLNKVDGLEINRGEINQSTLKTYISSKMVSGAVPLLKGAGVGQYQIREEMSQGEFEYFLETKYVKDKGGPHHLSRKERIVTQRITGTDERLRVVAAKAVSPMYFADSTNSITVEKKCKYSIYYILALLNSDLYQWRFKITSTNNNVGTNELELMPFIEIDFSSSSETKYYKDIVSISSNLCKMNYQDDKKIEIQRVKVEDLITKLFNLSAEDIAEIYQVKQSRKRSA
ncbi:MAG TPA: N-6 DNA methylase [Bacteriovoracaceae bacterium]|nr:N-6 DNA methylase [Bacteriovoracaceae bacterium]